jgi:hypothetical protein
MSNCEGKGTCYEHCACECYDAETDEDYEVCSCGHRIHKLKYCRKDPCVHNCEFIKCKNFDICGISTPEWDMKNHPGGEVGLCFECWAYRGKLKKTPTMDECGICLEDKILVELSCHSLHKICIDCWDKSIHSKKYPSICPLCRKTIGSWKFNMSS